MRTALLQTAERTATRQEIDMRLGDVDARAIACGHGHVPRAVRTGRGQLPATPGSVGLPAYADDFPYPHVVETVRPMRATPSWSRAKGTGRRR